MRWISPINVKSPQPMKEQSKENIPRFMTLKGRGLFSCQEDYSKLIIEFSRVSYKILHKKLGLLSNFASLILVSLK